MPGRREVIIGLALGAAAVGAGVTAPKVVEEIDRVGNEFLNNLSKQPKRNPSQPQQPAQDPFQPLLPDPNQYR